MSKAASLLKSKAATSKPKKSEVPTLPPRSFYDTVANAYIAMTEAEAAFRAVEGELILESNAVYADNAKGGSFSKSYNFPGNTTAGVQVTYQDRFYAIASKDEDALKEIMGDKYDVFFQEKRELSLADTSDANIDMLVEKLGEELFLQIFKIKLNITPKADMDRRQFDLPTEARVYLKQYKPSLKLGK